MYFMLSTNSNKANNQNISAISVIMMGKYKMAQRKA